ncbi:MAG: NAD(P)/FAD-dependent oxidoreductase [Saprospiraceae bacterium]|jgi:glycine oxidase
MKTDFLIVGQGLAGTFLAHYLRLSGASVAVMDNGHDAGASVEAAGLINPITGRHYAKSWRVDELLPFAAGAYRSQEQALGRHFYHERPIVRAFFSPKESNDWWARASEPDFADYFAAPMDAGPLLSVCRTVYEYAAVRQSAQVDVRVLLEAFAAKARREGWLFSERMDYAKIIPETGGIRYGDIETGHIIFCEGYGAAQNPFFRHLPMEGAKGELLIVRIPDFPEDLVLKHKIFIAPLGDGLFWAGATYDRRFPDARPTAERATFLKAQLTEILKGHFEVLDHRAAVRPTVKDRRPLLGFHLRFPRLAIFNGLGTKGASLAPFWAHHFSRVLSAGVPLDPEVDIGRFNLP